MVKEKNGRRNRYHVQAHRPLPEPDGRERTVDKHAGRDQGNRPGGSRVRPDGPNATVEAIRPGLGPGRPGKQATGRT